MGLDYCFQILKRLSFGKAVDLFSMEPEDKIKTEGGSRKKTDSASEKEFGHWSLRRDNGDSRWLCEVLGCPALEMFNGRLGGTTSCCLPPLSALGIGALLFLSVRRAWCCTAGG